MKEHATGRVLVNFVINTDGSIDEVKILRSVHPVLNEEAMRVIKEMPKWQPGMKDGKVVRVRFTMPITFSLNMNPPQMGN
jgi:TonB family protein